MDLKEWRRRICGRVREIRGRTGLSQMAFAHRADLNPNTVGLIERGDVFPSLETLIHLAEAHGVPLAEFLGEPEKATARKDRALRELVGILRGKDEAKIDFVLGLVRYVCAKL